MSDISDDYKPKGILTTGVTRPMSDLTPAREAEIRTLPLAWLSPAQRQVVADLLAALDSVRQERDALNSQLRGIGCMPYLDRLAELASERDTLRAALQAAEGRQTALKAWVERRLHMAEAEPYHGDSTLIVDWVLRRVLEHLDPHELTDRAS